jgi:hypothetical protein
MSKSVSSVSGGAGAGAGAGAAPGASIATRTRSRVEWTCEKHFEPAFTKKGFKVLLKIEKGEELTKEEEECEIFREDEDEDDEKDSDYVPSEDEDEEDEEEKLSERIARNRAIAQEARKEADRLMTHLLDLAGRYEMASGVLESIRKSYEEQKARETAAAMTMVGAYLDKRGFFGYAPNVGRVLDKELGEYAYIARVMLKDE